MLSLLENYTSIYGYSLLPAAPVFLEDEGLGWQKQSHSIPKPGSCVLPAEPAIPWYLFRGQELWTH